MEIGQPNRLGYASRSGQYMEILAEWERGPLDGTYLTDGSDCVVLHSTGAPDPGTHLALLPQETP